MTHVGVKELKNQLSRYLALVKKGDEVIITERGKTIARIVRESSRKESLLQQLNPLTTEGLISLPMKSIEKRGFQPIKLSGEPVSEMVIEDRR